MQSSNLEERRCSVCRASSNPDVCRICDNHKYKPIFINRIKYFFVGITKKSSDFHNSYVRFGKKKNINILFYDCTNVGFEKIRAEYVSIWLSVKDKKAAIDAGF